jgi:glycerol uptake facilitator-like aquaporin
MINVPIAVFCGISGPALIEQGMPYNILFYVMLGLLVVTNILLTITASTDPGIVPARNWAKAKQEIS